MKASTANYFNPAPALPINTAISQLTTLNVSQLLPTSPTAILQNTDYTDLLAATITDPDAAAAFTTALTNFLTTAATSPVGSYVNSTTYTNVPLGLADPLGFGIQSQFSAEFSTTYTNNLNNFLNANGGSAFSSVLINDFQTNISTAISQNMGLPRISQTVAAVKADVFNQMGAAIQSALDDVGNYIIAALELNLPSSITGMTSLSPLDYLFNLHRNLATRQALYSQNGSISQINAIEAYFESIFPGGTYTQAQLSALATQIESIM
jgi:hypothetical protein